MFFFLKWCFMQIWGMQIRTMTFPILGLKLAVQCMDGSVHFIFSTLKRPSGLRPDKKKKKHFKCQFKCQNLTHRGSWSGEWPYFLCLCAVHDWNQFLQEGLIRQNTNPLVLHRTDENSCCEKAARLRLTRGQLDEWPSAQTLSWDVCGCFKMKLWASVWARVRLNVCTSCWEKTGGLLFSSCTVTTTVQELFRPGESIVSVSDSRSTHQENDVGWRNKRCLFFFHNPVPESRCFFWQPGGGGVNIATTSPRCRSNKATDAVGDASKMPRPFLAPSGFMFSFLSLLCVPPLPHSELVTVI